MLKVAITDSFEGRNFWVNGMKLNIILWYDFLKKCNYDVTILCPTEVTHDKYKTLNFNKIYDSNNVIIENYRELYPELYDFDVVFNIGFYPYGYLMTIKDNGIKLIYIMLGSTYHNDVHYITDDNERYNIHCDYIFDEIWISPHFKYCQEYYKIRWKTEHVYLCPYFWGNNLFSDDILDNVLKDINNLKIGVVEPNIEQAKNCIIPFSICEAAEKYISNVKIYSALHLKNNKFFYKYLSTSELHKKGKLSIEPHQAMDDILNKWSNCIVSYVEDCDLNYVALECFYLGIPYIHNSPMLKDYGYYYPRLSISKGVEQIKYVIQNHNREEYIKKHKPLLEKYSINNPTYIAWTQKKLNKEINFDCE